MSAGASIRLFLLEVSVALVLVVVGAILARQWWAKRQKRQRWQEAVERAQFYALLNGQGAPRPAQGALPYPDQGMGGPVIVLPGQQYQPQPGITLDALAQALQAAQGRTDPLAGFLPPDEGGGWEVL